MNTQVIANESITATNVRVIGLEEGTVVMPTTEALARANDEGLDLVVVSNGDVPVVKIVDLNKFLYDQKQQEKKRTKAQRASAVKVKEIQMTDGIQENDLNVKANNALRMLSSGNAVRIVLKVTSSRRNQQAIGRATQVVEDFCARLGKVEFTEKVTTSGYVVTATVKASK